MNKESEIIEIGDLVKVKDFKSLSMRCQGQYEDNWASGKEGFVVSICPLWDYDWYKHHRDAARILINTGGEYDNAYVIKAVIKNLIVLKKGNGRVPRMGFEYPIPPFIERLCKLYDWDWKMRHHDHSYEGFVNAATFLAWFYIKNDQKCLNAVTSQRRKNGTINPEKIRKMFYQYKLKVDDWAFEHPIKPPEGYNHVLVDRWKPKVNWLEIAGNF
jgi:hypothetical protein